MTYTDQTNILMAAVSNTNVHVCVSHAKVSVGIGWQCWTTSYKLCV